MNHFLAKQTDEHTLIVEGDDARHFAKVLRARKGDRFTGSDGKGVFFDAEVRSISDGMVVGDILSLKRAQASMELALGIGILKKRDRFEFAVEKAVELGVREIFPLITQYSEKSKVRMDRLQSVAHSAFKQSQGIWYPQVHRPTGLSEMINIGSSYDLRLIAHEKSSVYPKDEVFQETDQVLVLIGPEGGFSEQEVRMAFEQGFNTLSLGSRRLRTETAAVVASSLFINRFS